LDWLLPPEMGGNILLHNNFGFFFHLFMEKGGAKTIGGPRRFPQRSTIPHGSPACALAAVIGTEVGLLGFRHAPRAAGRQSGDNPIFSENFNICGHLAFAVLDSFFVDVVFCQPDTIFSERKAVILSLSTGDSL
jgi:hypothetical protein